MRGRSIFNLPSPGRSICAAPARILRFLALTVTDCACLYVFPARDQRHVRPIMHHFFLPQPRALVIEFAGSSTSSAPILILILVNTRATELRHKAPMMLMEQEFAYHSQFPHQAY